MLTRPCLADILNYALTLEHLEASFYEEGFKNYTQEDFAKAGIKDTAYANIQKVGSDEKAHEKFLTQALSAAGAKPVERCTYSFPSTDAKSFLALGSVLEGKFLCHLFGCFMLIRTFRCWCQCLPGCCCSHHERHLPVGCW